MDKNMRFGMDRILLANGFAYYDDWEYGPVSGWSPSFDHVSLKLMEHDSGYWIIFSRHAGGENISMNIGSTNNAFDIIDLREILMKVKG